MMISNKIKTIAAAAVVAISGVAGMVAAPGVLAATTSSIKCQSGWTLNSTTGVCEKDDTTSLWTTVNNIINWVLGIVGFIAVVMIIVGGLNYTLSAGDSTKVKKAKDTILYGIIGLVIALLAAAIVNFVLGGVFG